MTERIEYLIRQIQKLEQRRASEADEDIQEIIDDKIKALQNELYDLQQKLQPQRFEQVIEVIIEKCQEMIDNNDIFVDGDKDIFLKYFVEPYLRSNQSKAIQEKHARTSMVSTRTINDIDNQISSGKNTERKRGAGKRDGLTDYVIPAIKLIKNGTSHTEAFRQLADQLDVRYQTVNAQCTRVLGISTDKFLDLVNTGKISDFLKNKFSREHEIIDREL